MLQLPAISIVLRGPTQERPVVVHPVVGGTETLGAIVVRLCLAGGDADRFFLQFLDGDRQEPVVSVFDIDSFDNLPRGTFGVEGREKKRFEGTPEAEKGTLG